MYTSLIIRHSKTVLRGSSSDHYSVHVLVQTLGLHHNTLWAGSVLAPGTSYLRMYAYTGLTCTRHVVHIQLMIPLFNIDKYTIMYMYGCKFGTYMTAITSVLEILSK